MPSASLRPRGAAAAPCAHRDIAFEFGSWLSPEFKLYLTKEIQRLRACLLVAACSGKTMDDRASEGTGRLSLLKCFRSTMRVARSPRMILGVRLADRLNHLPGEGASPSERLLQAFELHELGVLMQIEKLKRKYPGISEHELTEKIASWLAREGED